MSSKTFLKKNIFSKFCSFFGSEKTSKQRLGLAAAAEDERECVCLRERVREKDQFFYYDNASSPVL